MKSSRSNKYVGKYKKIIFSSLTFFERYMMAESNNFKTIVEFIIYIDLYEQYKKCLWVSGTILFQSLLVFF